MDRDMDQYALWRRTLAVQNDGFESQREHLRQGFLAFRARVAHLVGEIGGLLPQLTVHDITHLDALWRVAGEIAGPAYPLNPAEAFVLGGAFLLHDAAHVLAAYDNGLFGVKSTPEWKDLIAHRYGGVEPSSGSHEELSALFVVLRNLHAKQARHLPTMSWTVPGTGERLHLIESFDLRDYYGDLIGEIAESHHWPAYRVAEIFEARHLNSPAFLAPANWHVDALKVAFLLRTADAAHVDGLRAPWFLFALRHPDGVSQLHWKFQAKMGQPRRMDRGELRLSSGSRFGTHERQAWWLAYETACMIDGELRGAQTLMREMGRAPFDATSVENVTSPEVFATNVQTSGWEPVNVAPKVGDVPGIIANLGGAALYGDRPELALRELIQNAADAIRALRMLGEIGSDEGQIEVSFVRDGNMTWLHVTDTGVGMSRYVLTEVLLDFGSSLWRDESLRTELPGLASKGFKSVGRFGIGFFSVFMLGRRVSVTTRRFRKVTDDKSDQWLLEFDNGLQERPTLRRPSASGELSRPGTRVSVALEDSTLVKLVKAQSLQEPIKNIFNQAGNAAVAAPGELQKQMLSTHFARSVSALCPTLDIKVCVRVNGKEGVMVVYPDDWKHLPSDELLSRLYSGGKDFPNQRLVNLQESSGSLIGRIGYHNGYFSSAIATHRGLLSGEVPGIVGVVLGRNNEDLIRSESEPLASQEAWIRWANEWVGVDGNARAEALVDLHPIVPERDFAIYKLNGDRLTEAELEKILQAQNEVSICAEFPEYDDYKDDVSRNKFESYFEPGEGIVFFPSTRGVLAKALGFPSINYTERFEAVLRKAWGAFDESIDDEGSVGDVEGTDIVRFVTQYTRPQSE